MNSLALCNSLPLLSPVVLQQVTLIYARQGRHKLGAFTPTEILTASNAGADLVKVFPATRLGPSFFRDVLAPMPGLKLTPTGGVDLETAGEFIKAGAATLGVGSSLVEKKALQDGDFGRIATLAKQFVDVVAKARAQM